jgi:pyrroloquinoline quinone (PQQ) biosynthesis protein C
MTVTTPMFDKVDRAEYWQRRALEAEQLCVQPAQDADDMEARMKTMNNTLTVMWRMMSAMQRRAAASGLDFMVEGTA